ncbi:hypothetical protein VPNG_05285 [Cytospora leucostoma]|uniref:Uncharacterized protein n=1 Tax=Cytospora leucostoma TaxID=1230097 RepID=A0A423X863_9PEZI|nr:hypothetical protein VPNG_05285 [Cytospora leucostoma]
MPIIDIHPPKTALMPDDGEDTLKRSDRDCITVPFSGDSGPGTLSKRVGITLETVVFKRVDGLELGADIYYPALARGALLIHGGSHFLLTRREVPMKHVKTLLKRGFLPVSVDFRLCPELPLAAGGVPDVIDALSWVRKTLPHIQRARPDVQLDGTQVMVRGVSPEPHQPLVFANPTFPYIKYYTSDYRKFLEQQLTNIPLFPQAAGWSSGGQLAMIMGFLAAEKGIKPPEVIVSFYGMCDLESAWWRTPLQINWAMPYSEDDLLAGVEDKPTAGVSPERVAGVVRNPIADNPRGRFAIHVFLKAQMVPILVNGLPTRAKARDLRRAGDETDYMAMPEPPVEAVRAISPYAQMLVGHYHIPTFFAHGDNDKEVPVDQSRDASAALRASNIETGCTVARGAGHSFDFRPEEDPLHTGWAAAQEAYDWAQRFIDTE